MKTIKINNAELLLVKVPRDTDYNYFPNIGYQIVNTLSKLTEEQAKELVDQCPYFAKCWKKYNLVEIPTGDFNTLSHSYWTALESFHSLMAVNEVYLSNPYYEMPKWRNYTDRETFRKAILEYQQAEHNTSEYLILIKK